MLVEERWGSKKFEASAWRNLCWRVDAYYKLYTGGFVHQCTAADVIINPSAPFSAGGVVVVVVCMRKRKGKNKIKKERSSGGGKETETSLGGVGWGSGGSGGGPYGWIRFFCMPPNRFCCDWLGSYSHRSRSVSNVIDSLPLSRTAPRLTNPSTLVSENVQTNDDTTVVWLSPL
jgi:hypothetical protein